MQIPHDRGWHATDPHRGDARTHDGTTMYRLVANSGCWGHLLLVLRASVDLDEGALQAQGCRRCEIQRRCAFDLAGTGRGHLQRGG